MATVKEHEKLIEVLKFTPRTYKITMWGYGGEYIMGTVDRKIYDYFRHRRLDLSDFAWQSDYAEENNIPEEMWPFSPGSYYDCDDMGHIHGVDRNAGTLQIDDENGETIWQKELENITGGNEDEPEWGGGEEVWITSKPAGTVVFLGVSNEKGTFFEGEIELKQPFDITKLTLSYDEFDGNDIISGVEYDGEQIDNFGGDTNGKSSDFGFYLVKDLNSWEKYSNLDDIDYEMTEWFSKKVKPVHVGQYMIKTAGKNSWEHRGTWTGTNWVNSWTEPEDYSDPDKIIKIKEWRGLAQDPDAGTTEDRVMDLEDALEELKAEFEALMASDAAEGLKLINCACKGCAWEGPIDDTLNNADDEMVCPECSSYVEILSEEDESMADATEWPTNRP
jgi:hypothetical protein